ncbi:MAG: hypothetical protein JWO44_1418 [Bacteroidetes bacterium]|jgi:hypothetical protein|nr:hypothetical protein [Bacteroidota bacterium]
MGVVSYFVLILEAEGETRLRDLLVNQFFMPCLPFILQPTNDFLHHVIWQPKLPAFNEK